MRTLCISLITVALLAASAVRVAGQDEDETPTSTYVTGTIVESFGEPSESSQEDGVERVRMTDERALRWSDPRLPSRMITRTILDGRVGVRPDGPVSSTVMSVRYRLEGADGVWTGTGRGFGAKPESEPSESFGPMFTEQAMLTGEGAYEGLSAILLLRVGVAESRDGRFVFEGYIYEGGPPPIPEPIEPGAFPPQ